MQKLHKGVISVTFVFVLISLGLVVFGPQPPSGITGFAVHSNSCGGSISAEGFWELNASMSCDSGDGVVIDVSNVLFDCNNYPIVGEGVADSNGISVSGSLTNVSIVNCNVSSFHNAINIGSGTTLNIEDSTASGDTACVVGVWMDLGGNTGCFDTAGPNVSVSDQTVYTNESFSYQVSAVDMSTISNYSVDSGDFAISSSGLLTNATNMTAGNNTLNVNATDSEGNMGSGNMVVEILEGVLPVVEEEEENEDDGSDDDDDDSSGAGGGGSSSGSEKSTPSLGKNCTESEAWKCSGWSECVDGVEKRTCEKKDTKCNTPLPETKRSCSGNSGIGGGSSGGSEVDVTVETSDTLSEETIEASEEQGDIVLTGGAITAIDTAKDYVLKLRDNLVIVVVVVIIIIGFILTMFLQKKKSKFSKRPLSPKTRPKEKGDIRKLFDWEEKN
jgi:hypothetical protein